MQAFDSGRLSHAYIVSGPSEDSRFELARHIARAIVCSSEEKKPCGKCSNCVKAENGVHPDIITVEREPGKREIYVDKMRAVRSDAALLPNDAAKKVYIIKDADAMNIQAQNAMLKTLEEPPSFAAFLLVAESSSALLPTVRSRCLEVSSAPAGTEPESSSSALDFLKTMSSSDRTSLMRLIFSLEKMDKNDLSVFILDLRRLAASGLRGEAGCPDIPGVKLAHLIRTLDKAEIYAGSNVGAGHISGLLMSELI